MKTTLIIVLALLLTVKTHSQITLKIDEAFTSQNKQQEMNDEFHETTFLTDEQAQNSEIQTLFKKDKRNGFYGAISMGYSPIDNKHGAVFSTRGCLLMDRWFGIGLGGTAFINNINNIDNYYNPSTSEHLTGAYGGLVLEPIAFPMKPIHLSFPVTVGGGVAVPFNNNHYAPYTYIEEYFFVLEPGIELEVNFTRWLRVAAFATYRYTSDINIENISKSALRSYSTGLTLKVGLF